MQSTSVFVSPMFEVFRVSTSTAALGMGMRASVVVTFQHRAGARSARSREAECPAWEDPATLVPRTGRITLSAAAPRAHQPLSRLPDGVDRPA